MRLMLKEILLDSIKLGNESPTIQGISSCQVDYKSSEAWNLVLAENENTNPDNFQMCQSLNSLCWAMVIPPLIGIGIVIMGI